MIDRLAWIWVVQVVFVYCMWVVLGVVIIVAIVSSVAVGPVIHEPKTRPSLSRVQLTERLLLHHGSLQTGSPSSSCQQQVACKQPSQKRSTVPLSMQRFRNNGLHSQPSNTTQ